MLKYWLIILILIIFRLVSILSFYLVALVSPFQGKITTLKRLTFITTLNELLKYIPGNCTFLEEDVDICTERVNDLLLAAADMCMPTFTVKKKTNPPRITKEIFNKIKKKKGLWRKLKAHPSEILSRKFKELRRSIKQLVRSEYKRYLEHLSSQLKVNPKRFWSYH